MDKPRSIYEDGRHYDAKYEGLADDIPFIFGLALECGSPILELGCGTGRITLPLVRQGLEVCGLDSAEPMLKQARAKAAAQGLAVEWVCADFRSFDLSGRSRRFPAAGGFKLAFMAFNTVAHLHDEEELASCLGAVRAHLAPGGKFMLDMFNPGKKSLANSKETHCPVLVYPDPDGSGRIKVMESCFYEPRTKLRTVRWRHVFEDGREMVEDLVQRMWLPGELDAALRQAGFVIEARYGNYDGSPFHNDSDKQIIVSRL